MKDWRKTLVYRETSILEALRLIDEEALQIALVVDCEQRLQGTVTDGDVRRGLLKGLSLQDSVEKIMHSSPITVLSGTSHDDILELMQNSELNQLPILDEKGQVIGLETRLSLRKKAEKKNKVILMAGGLGMRLRPLTENCPKPLLKVGDKPILETILDSFIEHGYKDFMISVNYKAHMVEEYFGNGGKWGCSISYIREQESLGTAGALSLIEEPIIEPFFVMNGDLLTKINFSQLAGFHEDMNADATMCVRTYQFQVPYGVVEIENNHIFSITEKPVQQFFMNGGVYMFNPQVLNLLKRGKYMDMPDFFSMLINGAYNTIAFPIREYWLDIGQMSDFSRANQEFAEVFI